MSEKEQTRCFTYEVKMVIQVLDTDENKARALLDDKGGYVSSREVVLIDSVPLYSGSEDQLTLYPQICVIVRKTLQIQDFSIYKSSISCDHANSLPKRYIYMPQKIKIIFYVACCHFVIKLLYSNLKKITQMVLCVRYMIYTNINILYSTHTAQTFYGMMSAPQHGDTLAPGYEQKDRSPPVRPYRYKNVIK